MVMVNWWRWYSAVMELPFRWPVLSRTSILFLIKSNNLELCWWWWEDTMRKGPIMSADTVPQLLAAVNDMCVFGRVRFLDWVWDLCATNTDMAFPGSSSDKSWRPRHPFIKMSVIGWWEAKVATGAVDPGVFGIEPRTTATTRLDRLLEPPNVSTGSIEIVALDWWWARRNQFQLEPNFSHSTIAGLVDQFTLNPACLPWYLDRCVPGVSTLPDLTPNLVAVLAFRDQLHVVEQVWRLNRDNGGNGDSSLAASIGAREVNDRAPVWTQLDRVWAYCTRFQVPMHEVAMASARHAMGMGCLDEAKWWYTTHCVHGTDFPSLEEVCQTYPVPTGGEVDCWVQSLSH